MKKRDDNGRFLKGISGNPTGKCKDGSIPQQDSPITDARNAIAQIGNDNESLIESEKEAILKKSIAVAKKGNDKILALWTEFYLRQELAKQGSRPPQEGKPARRRDQIEMEFLQQIEERGMKLIPDGDVQNRFAAVPIPANGDSKNAGEQE